MVNRYDRPAEAQFINTYVPLPFQQLYTLGKEANARVDKAIADLYSQKSNIENQYKGEYANTLNNLGQQFVSARNMSTDLNARSRAAARNINREALSQISNYAQNRRLMNNQRSRDMAMLDAYAPFLESIYTTEDYSNLMNKFRR